MTGLVETIWLFVRGDESVRVIRAATPEGGARLLIYGPGNTQATHEFQDPVTCTHREAELERELVHDGYSVETAACRAVSPIAAAATPSYASSSAAIRLSRSAIACSSIARCAGLQAFCRSASARVRASDNVARCARRDVSSAVICGERGR